MRGARRARRGLADARGLPSPFWGSAAYWLLYVVALAGALVHWRAGNHLAAVLCAAAMLVGAGLIVHAHRRGA